MNTILAILIVLVIFIGGIVKAKSSDKKKY